MRILGSAILVTLVLVADAFAHGGGHRNNPPPPPPPPPNPPPFHGPNSGVAPGTRPPSDPAPETPAPTTPDPDTPAPETPAPPHDDPSPTTPPPDPGHPTTPPPPGGPPPAGGPQPPQGPPQGAGPRSSARGATVPTSWRVWWEFNREYLLGLRGLLRSNRGVVSGGAGTRPAPSAPRRADIRRALRAVVVNKRNDSRLRGAASIALGRAGEPSDVDFLLEPLRSRREAPAAATAAALGLGILPPLEDESLRDRLRAQFDRIVTLKDQRDRNIRGFVIVATGLRARHDRTHVIGLANYAANYARDSYDVAALVYACGISRDPMLLAELMLAARRSSLGGRDLDDAGRSHAVFGLGMQRSPVAIDLLRRILKSRKSGIQTRRAAALALGRLLRETELEADDVDSARRALVAALEKDRDAVLRSYCAIALAAARTPLEVDRLMRIAGRTGGPTLRTYAALGVGLAARATPDGRRPIQRFLATELARARDIEYASAVSIALGLAGAVEATPDLIARVENRRLPAPVRGAAAEALGLLQQPHGKTATALMHALRTGPLELVEGAAIGLGLIGRHGVAKELAQRLERAKSGGLQGRLTLAMAHLGQEAAVDPLLRILGDKNQPRVPRELAAVALGILGDARTHDVLFELDAYYNYFATTILTHELLMIF